MRFSLPTKHCYPCFTNCTRHSCDTMLQIYSLKLNLPAKATQGSAIQLYGFMAARDLLDPLRNYIFNRSRDDPYIVQDVNSDPFLYLPGPKRGVYLQSPVLVEYDMRIKNYGGREEDDQPLIDGAFTCSELAFVLGPFTYRINGERRGASVDISRALFRGAVEATVEARIVELAAGSVDLSVCALVPPTTEEIKLFRGTVDGPCRMDRFVVAVISDSFLLLVFKVAGAPLPDLDGRFAFRAVAHGCISSRQKFSFGTVEVKVTWSGLC